MEIKENERKYISVLVADCKWEEFYSEADRVERKLRTKFTDKIDDFDSQYWHFLYIDTDFVLHYHERIGDVEVFTDKKNGKDKLIKLLIDLKE